MARQASVSSSGRFDAGILERRTFVAGGAAALGAAIVGSGRASAQVATTTLRVASNAADDVTPVLWAQHTGAFSSAGLDVVFTRMNSGAAVTAAVIGGALDIGKSSLMPLISAHARDIPIAIVAPGELWITEAPLTGLITAKTSPIATAKDLDGKTIATAALRDVSWLATHAWLDQHGGDSQTVKFVEMPQAAMVGAIMSGRVDAATITNPGFSAAMATGSVKVIGAPSDGIAKRFLLTAWFTTNDYIAKNAATVGRFAGTVEQSAAYTNAHSSETIAMLADFSGIEPAALAHMTRGVCGTRLQPEEVQPVIDAALKYGIIDHRFEAKELVAKL
jgi:NitT/TauT family transport system substrate-binding protein